MSAGRFAFAAVVAAMFVFLLAPVIMIVPMSLSADESLAWPPSGWTLRWYAAIFEEPGLGRAFANSLLLASVVTALSLSIAFPAALALARGRLAVREALTTFLTLPLLLPSVVLGLALFIVLVEYGLIGSWLGLLAAHLLMTLPYAVRVLLSAFATLPHSVEDAAASLGATPSRVLLRITLPLMSRGIVAAAAIVFLVSFDEVVVSLFVVGPQLTTFPVALFHYVEARTDPLVAAVSAMLIGFTVLAVLILERAMGVRRVLGK